MAKSSPLIVSWLYPAENGEDVIDYDEPLATQRPLDLRTDYRDAAKIAARQNLQRTEEARKGMIGIQVVQGAVKHEFYFCPGERYIISKADIEGRSGRDTFLTDIDGAAVRKIGEYLKNSRARHAFLVTPWGIDFYRSKDFVDYYANVKTLHIRLISAGFHAIRAYSGIIRNLPPIPPAGRQTGRLARRVKEPAEG